MNSTKKSGESITERLLKMWDKSSKRVSSFIKRTTDAFLSCAPIKKLCEEKTVTNIIMISRCIGLCCAGFLFGICGIDSMAYPLGLALLIASGRLSFFVYAGSAAAALTYPALGFAFFGVNTLIYIIRKILLSDNFSESWRSRVILSFITAFFVSFALFAASSSGTLPGIKGFDLFLCCSCYIIGIPLGVLLLYPVTSGERFGSSTVTISLCSFCACLIMACSFVPLKPLVYFAACVCTLLFCTMFDGYVGVPAGAVFGLATLDFVFCAPLCISAFVFLRLYKRIQLLIYPLFAVCCIAISLFTFGDAYRMAVIYGTVIATAVFMPVGLVISSRKTEYDLSSPVPRETVTEVYTGRMAALSGAFGAVSKLCFGFSNRMRFPSEDETQALVSVCTARACSKCERFQSCRIKQFWCDRRIAEGLISDKLTPSVLPEKIVHFCPCTVSVVKELNDEYGKLLTERFNNNKTEILAYEYATLGRILKYTSRISSEDVYYDTKLSALANAATKKIGLPNTGVTVYGTRKKVLDICGVPVSSVSTPSEKLCAFYGAQCGELFDCPEFILDEDGTFTVRMRSKELISTEYVTSSHTKNGETVSGDTVSFFRSDDSYFYALIADGMGSGRDAAMTSRLTSVFVEKLLSGGAGKGVTMELLNNLLMSKNKECFSSVDLLEIDLIKKKASFVKAGAAPAYLLRSAKLFKVSSDTPPCGIIEGFSAENTSFELFPGDIIIMLSDGITSSIDCGTSLCDIMNNAKGESLETIAGKILDMAVSMSVHDDDMSCVIVRVK